MIDWFRGEIPFMHDPLPAGRVMSIEPDGSIAWESVKANVCRSTYETSVKVRSSGGDGYGFATSLLIDGNISKFLQGHNVFGSRDLNRLVLLSFRKIFALYFDHLEGWSSPDLTEAKIKKGDYLVKMVDINQLYDVGNDASVEAWLHAAHMRAVTRHGRANRDKGTVYLGQHSRRWSLKFYNKFREMSGGKSHGLPLDLQDMGLEEFVEGKLRAELRLHARELQERYGITHGHHMTLRNIQQLFDEYMGRLEMTTQATLIDEQLIKMPRTILGTYQLWRQGANVKALLALTTYKRHRCLLLEYGIDINSPPLSPEHNNVVPLIRIIEAKPVQNPAWAYERGLIAA